MRIDVPELKPHMTIAEKHASAAGMAHAIFHFQREAAYMFINGGEGDQCIAERLRDMCTELMLEAGKLTSEAHKMEADKARLDEIREEVEKALKPKSKTKRRDRLGSDCIEDDGRCNCDADDIAYAHVLAVTEDNVRMANGSYFSPRTYRRQ